MATLEPVSLGVRIGIDLGKVNDPSAIVVVEAERRDYELDPRGYARGGEVHYLVRHLERLPLGTTYPAVADRLAEIYHTLAENYPSVDVVADATGVGVPVIDLLRKDGLYVKAVYITGTDKVVEEGGEIRLGKALLVSRLQVLLQCGQIHLPKTSEADALVEELLHYEIRISDDAHATFGAFKTGKHDDLCTALGLAVWQRPRRPISFGFA